MKNKSSVLAWALWAATIYRLLSITNHYPFSLQNENFIIVVIVKNATICLFFVSFVFKS